MRLLITVVCCLIVIHGSFSVPGFRRKQAKRLSLAQPLGQGISLRNEEVKAGNGHITVNEEKQQSSITNLNIQNIIHDDDSNSVQKDTGIGNYNNNVIESLVKANENSSKNTDYNLLSSGTSNNGVTEDNLNSDSGINQIRSKREVEEPKKTVKTYRFESQPRISRFSYIQKIQKLFEPKQDATPKILTKHKTIVVENHAEHEEHHSEEIHEHHTTTTSQLKISKKKRRSKRKPGTQGTSDTSEDYEDEETTEEEIAETESLPIKNEKESNTNISKLKSTRVVQSNVSVMENRNGTKNLLEKNKNNILTDKRLGSSQITTVSGKKFSTSEKVSDSRDAHALGITNVISKKIFGTSRSSNNNPVNEEKGTIVKSQSPTSGAIKTVTNISSPNRHTENLTSPSTLPLQNDIKLSRQNVPSNGKNLKSVLTNIFGLRGNKLPTQTSVQIGNPPSVLREILSKRNISTLINNLDDKRDSNHNTIINDKKHIFNVPNAAKKLTTFLKQQVKGPSKPSRIKVNKYRKPNVKSVPPSMGSFYNTDIIESEVKNPKIDENVDFDSSKTTFKDPELIGNLPYQASGSQAAQPVSNLMTENKNRSSIAPATREYSVIDTIDGPKKVGNNPAVARSPRVILNQQNVAPFQSSVPREIKLKGDLSTDPKIAGKRENIKIPSSQTTQTIVPKFRRPKSDRVTTSKEILYDENVIDSEEKNTEINHNIGINYSKTGTEKPGRIPSVPLVTNVLTNVPTAKKSTTKIINSSGVPSSQSTQTRAPKFRRPKDKKITTSKEVLYDENVIDSAEEIPEIDYSKTVPKEKQSIPTAPIVTNVPANVPTSPKSTTKITNLSGVPSSQPTQTRVPKFRRPKGKKITTSKEVLYDENAIGSEEENADINQDIDRNKIVTKKPGRITPVPIPNNVLANVPTAKKSTTPITKSSSGLTSQPTQTRVPKYREPKSGSIALSKDVLPDESVNTKSVPKSTTTIKKSPFVLSLEPSVTRVPNFRRPKSKIITTSKEVSYDVDITDSEEGNTETIKNVSGNIPILTDKPLNVPTTSKSKIPTINQSFDAPLQQPKGEGKVEAVSRSPQLIPTKFRRPNSKTSKEILYDRDIPDSEEDKGKINNFEIDDKNKVIKIPKTAENISSVPIAPQVPSYIPAVPKPTINITSPSGFQQSKPSETRFPKFRRPKGKTITSKEILYDTDIIDSEEENTETINDVEIESKNSVTKVPKVLGNRLSIPTVFNVPANVPGLSKSITMSSKPVNAPLQKSKISRNDPAISRSPRVIVDEIDLTPSQPSRFSKFIRPQNKNGSTSPKIVNSNDDRSKKIYPPENKDNIFNPPQAPKTIANIPTAQKSTNVDKKNQAIPRSPPITISPLLEPSLTGGIPKFTRPQGKATPSSYDADTDSEKENLETNHNIGTTSEFQIGNVSPLSALPHVTKNQKTFSKGPKTLVRPSAPPNTPNAIGNFSPLPRSPVSTESQQFISSKPPITIDLNLVRPKNKEAIESTEGISNLDDLDSKDTNTDVNNDDVNTVEENVSPNNNIPKLSKFIPDFIRSFSNIKNWPETATLQPSLVKRIPKIGPVSTLMDVDNDDYKWETYGPNINEETSKYLNRLLPMGDSSFIPNKWQGTLTDNFPVPKSSTTSKNQPFNVPKNSFNLPQISSFLKNSLLPTLARNLSDATSSAPDLRKWLDFAPTQPSSIKLPKLRTPKTKTAATSMVGSHEIDGLNVEEEDMEIDNENVIDNNKNSNFGISNLLKKLPTIPKLVELAEDIPARFPKVFENEPLESSTESSVTKIPEDQKPKKEAVPTSNDRDVPDSEKSKIEIDNESGIYNTNEPKIAGVFPGIPRSPRISEYESLNAPSQVPIMKNTKPQEPKTKADPTSKDSGRYSPESNYNTNKSFDIPGSIFNQPSTSKLGDNVPDVSRVPTIYGNMPNSVLSESSPTKTPELGRQKNKPIPPSSKIFSHEFNDKVKPFSDEFNSVGNFPSFNSESRVIENISATPTPQVYRPNSSPSRPSQAGFSNLESPKSYFAPSSPETSSNNKKFNAEGLGPENHDSTKSFFKLPQIGKIFHSVPKMLAADNLPEVTRSSTPFRNWPFFALHQTSPVRSPKPKSKTDTSSLDLVSSNEKLDSDEYNSDVNDGTETLFTVPQSNKIHAVSRSPSIKENRPVIASSQPSKNKVTKLKKPKSKLETSPSDSDAIDENINGFGDNDISETFFTVPQSDKTNAVPRSPSIMENRPATSSSQPSKTRIPKLRRPKGKLSPSPSDSDIIDENINGLGDHDSTESFFNIPQTKGNVHSVSKIPEVALNLPEVTKSSTSFGNWPFSAPTQTSPARVPKLRRPKSETTPSSTDDAKDRPKSETYNTDVNDNTEPFFNLPQSDKTIAVPRSPSIMENRPATASLQPSNTRVPKLRRPKGKLSPSPSDSDINENINDSGDKNISETFIIVPQSDKTNAVPRSPSVMENRPVTVTSQPSKVRVPKLRRPKGKLSLSPPDSDNFDENISGLGDHDSPESFFNIPQTKGNVHSLPKVPEAAINLPEVTRSPMSFGNWPFFAPSQTSPGRVPKLRRPKSDKTPSSTDNVKEKPNSETYNTDVNDNTEPFFNLPQSDKTNAVPRSPSIMENRPATPSSQPSKTRVPKLRKPKGKLSPSPSDSDNIDENINGLGDHDSPESFFNIPQTKGNVHSLPKVPEAAINLPEVTRSSTSFGNWPFFAPSQTSPARVPKLRRPKSETTLSSRENVIERPNLETYNTDVNDNTETFLNLPQPDNILAVARSPATQGNRPLIAPSQPSNTRFPNLRWPKSNFAPFSPERFSENEDFHPDRYRTENEDRTGLFFNPPQKGKNFHSVPKISAAAYNLPEVTRLSTPFGNWPSRVPKLRKPKNKTTPSSWNIDSSNEKLNSEVYNPVDNSETENVFTAPQSDKMYAVPRSPATQGNRPVIAPSPASNTRVPKQGQPKGKTLQPSTQISHVINEFNPEIDRTFLNHDNGIYNNGILFNAPKSAEYVPFIPRVPTVTENFSTPPSTMSNRPREKSFPKIESSALKHLPSYQSIMYNDDLIMGRHPVEVHDDTDTFFNVPKFAGNIPFIPKVPKATGSIKYISRAPTPLRTWPVNGFPQGYAATLPKLTRPNIMVFSPSYYESSPSSEIYNTRSLYNAPGNLGRSFIHPNPPFIKYNVPKVPLAVYNQPFLPTSGIARINNGIPPISKQFTYRKVVPNYEIYDSNFPSIIGRVKPVPKVSKSLYVPQPLNIPTVVGNGIFSPKVSLMPKISQRVPMIIGSHPQLISSPAYTAMKFPAITKSKNWVVPSVRKSLHGLDAINLRSYNTFLRNISPPRKTAIVRKSQELPIQPSSLINLPKARSGLSKNRVYPLSERNSGIFNMETYNPESTDTVHLQIDEHDTVDMVAFEKRAGRTVWGIPISNAVGKIDYLTVGNQKGDMKFITSTDRTGRVVYLYQVRDDTGRSHNLHLKTTGGHLSLVESDYYGGQRSTGFVGYDETGEYIVPIHFEENHRLVIDPYAHSLRYAVDVHPAYDIVTEVFYYKK